MKRHIALASSITALIIVLYLLNKIGFMLTTALLIFLFPYISFSIFFYVITPSKKKSAIDVIRKKGF